MMFLFFFSSRRRHTRLQGDWSSDVCSSDLVGQERTPAANRSRISGQWCERGQTATDKWVSFGGTQDRKSTRLNSSHLVISYAVFCLKKKKKINKKQKQQANEKHVSHIRTDD